jgi:hypothetical protein
VGWKIAEHEARRPAEHEARRPAEHEARRPAEHEAGAGNAPSTQAPAKGIAVAATTIYGDRCGSDHLQIK